MMHRRFFISFVLILLIVPDIFAHATDNDLKSRKIIIRGSDAYAPFEYLDKNGNPCGFNVDIIRALMKELGLDYDLKLEKWDKIIENVKQKKVDIIPGMIYSDERLQFVDFGLPLCAVNRNIITLKDLPYNSISTIKGKRIIVQKDGWSHRYVEKEKLTDKLILTKDMDESLEALQENRGDVIIGNDNVAYFSIKRHGYDNIKIYSLGIDPQDYSIAVSKDNQQLLYHVNLGIQQLKASGEYSRIYNKWFGVYENQSYLVIIGASLLTTLVIILLSLYFMRHYQLKEKRAKAKLTDTSNELQLAIEAGDITAWVLDPKSRIISSLYGMQIMKDGDCLDDFFDRVDEKYLGNVTTMFDEIIKGEKDRGVLLFKTKSEDDTARYYETNMKRINSTLKKQTVIVGTMKDVTDDVNSRAELISMKEKAEESNNLKSAFLANMSHEIRTPLNAIVGFSNLLVDGEENLDNTEKESFKDTITSNSNLLLNLINDILDLSRIEAGSMSFSYRNVDFVLMFSQLALTLKSKAPDNIEFKCVSPLHSLCVYTEPTRLTQVITNFVTNAFKFTEHGSVTMGYEYEEEELYIYVADTGCGIPKDKLDSVFERFVKLNSFAQGTGLGLSISRAIIEILGGKIGVTSVVGEGSTFFIKLPCTLSPDELQDDETVHTEYKKLPINYQQSNAEENDGRPLILVAEDEDSNYQIIYQMLKKKYRICHAKNGKDAISMCERLLPNVVLMDMKMPVVGGLEATRRIRKYNPNIPIVALTAYVLDTTRESALEAGCNEYLTKPLKEKTLLEVLNRETSMK